MCLFAAGIVSFLHLLVPLNAKIASKILDFFSTFFQYTDKQVNTTGFLQQPKRIRAVQQGVGGVLFVTTRCNRALGGGGVIRGNGFSAQPTKNIHLSKIICMLRIVLFLSVLISGLPVIAQKAMPEERPPYVLVVHGGAGTMEWGKHVGQCP